MRDPHGRWGWLDADHIVTDFPTDAEREATERVIRSWTLDDAECIETQVDTILDALAPLIADRERAAAASDARAERDEAAAFVREWLDDDHALPIPGHTEWGALLYNALTLLVSEEADRG